MVSRARSAKRGAPHGNGGRDLVDRAQKEQFVEWMNDVFKETSIVIVSHNTGLTVTQLNAFRTEVRDVGGAVKVTKNRLVKRALEGTKFAAMAPMFVGPTTIAYAQDPVATAKTAVAFAKKNPKLVLLGGALGPMLLTAEDVAALAKMPPIAELRAKLLGVLKAPLVNTVGVLSAPAQKLVGVLAAPPRKMVGVLHAKAQQAEAA